MSAVFDRYPAGGGEMLLALALADVSRDDGVLMLNDSVPVLAQKTRQTERGVRGQLRRMQTTGWLMQVHASDGGRGRCSTYRISAAWLAGQALLPPAPGDEPDHDAGDDSAEFDEGGPSPVKMPAHAPQSTNPERASGFVPPETRNAATVIPEPRSGAYRPTRPNTLIPPNPPLQAKGGQAGSVLPKPKRQRLAASTLLDWLERCKAGGEHAIAEDDAVFAYARAVGIGDDLVALQWAEFKARRSEGRKRQADWRATFRNSVRGNWFKLWFIAAGQPAQLTTTGRQALAAMEARDRVGQGHGAVSVPARAPRVGEQQTARA